MGEGTAPPTNDHGLVAWAPIWATRRRPSAACDALAGLPSHPVVACSALYRTAPVGLPGQPDFINAAAALDTGLATEELLAAPFAEKAARPRAERTAPAGWISTCCCMAMRCLRCPASPAPPRLHLRAFVLVRGGNRPRPRPSGRGSGAAWLPRRRPQAIERL